MRTIFTFIIALSLSSPAFSQNLVAYYPFNGDAQDQSGHAINPTYIGSGVTLTTDRFGVANKAYNFDGAAGSYMRMPADALPTGNRTVSLWFNASSVTNKPLLLGYGGQGYLGYGTSFVMGLNISGCGCYQTQAHYHTNEVSYNYSTDPVNEWTHWVVTISGNNTKMYVNGNLVTNAPGSFTSNTFVTGTALAIGVNVDPSGVAPFTDPNGGYLQGKLDDIRIYDDAMTDAQVQALYHSEAPGLVAYYPFNGNENDESGNSINPLYNGAVLTTDRFGNPNSAYYFDGTLNSYMKIPADQLPTANRTISFWFNADEVASGPTLLSYGGDGSCGASTFLMGLNVTGLGGYVCEGHCNVNRSVYPYSTPPVNAWHHWTVSVNGSIIKMYLDGTLVQTDNVYSGATFVSGRFAVFGALMYIDGAGPYTGYFKGKMDEIRIYNNVLTDGQVSALYTSEANIIMPNLLAYLPMNGNANDMSGNLYNGIVTNASLATDKYDNTNSAYSFSGGLGRIELSNTSSLSFLNSSFSLSAWVRYSSNTGSPQVILGKHYCSTSDGYMLGVLNNQLFFWVSNGSFDPLLSADLNNDNKWHQLTGVYDNAAQQQYLYVDGVLKGSKSILYNSPAASGANITVGEPFNSCGVVFNGSIDEVKIYGAPLDAKQALALYQENRGSGNALHFNGINGKLNVGNTGWEQNNFTFEAWIKPDNSSNRHTLISPSGDQGLGILLDDSVDYNNSQTISLLDGGAWVPFCTIYQPVDGKWHYIALTYQAGNMVQVYWDGLLVPSSAASPFNYLGATYYLGASDDSLHFKGSMDELRFWNTVLTQSQIREWMNRKITPDHEAYANLVHYYNFNETNANHVYDLINASNGLLIDAPAWISSGAPIGDGSAFDFINAVKSATLVLASGESFTATENTIPTGTNIVPPGSICVYVVKDAPVILTGTLGVGGNDHYFGVHKSGGFTPQYTAVYNYTGNALVSPSTEPSLELFKRTDNSAITWENSGADLDIEANTLTATGQSTEYILGSSGFSLPVSLLNLQARKLNAAIVQLSWQTATETNNRGFELQHSFDGSYFTDLQFVNGALNSTELQRYQLTDAPGRYGRVYYRLKQIDLDDHSRFSEIVSVLFYKSGIIRIYPNPAQTMVTLEGIDNYRRIQMLDAEGKQVKDVYINAQYQVTISLDGLRSGMYLLRLVNGHDTQTFKLFIRN